LSCYWCPLECYWSGLTPFYNYKHFKIAMPSREFFLVKMTLFSRSIYERLFVCTIKITKMLKSISVTKNVFFSNDITIQQKILFLPFTN
jgi:hypothetical protein